ncbi:MAG: FAD binding domain-containing protein [Syntrophorhabdales bacterium]|jgi:4-hydroxybenzoyl-CoA reductase subunit beta
MNLPRFEFLGPTTVKETLSLMSKHREKLRLLAGGTEITGRLKHRLLSPAYIMSLKRVDALAGIKEKKNELVIGATTSLSEVADSHLIADLFRSVSDAARHVAAPAIRNVATVAGNLLQESRCLYYNQSELPRNGLGPCYKLGGEVCHAVKGGKRCFSVYQGDLAPALIAVGAQAKLQKIGSSRTLPVEDLFTGKGVNPIGLVRDELLTEVILPIRRGRSASAYQKFAIRGSIDYPLASAAVFLSEAKNGTIVDARIVLGAAGPGPKVAQDAATTIQRKRPQDVRDMDVQQVASLAAKTMEAVDNLILPASYRRKLAAVMTKRALEEALRSLREVEHARRT